MGLHQQIHHQLSQATVMWFISQSISVTLSREQIHLARRKDGGEVHESKRITTLSASSLLSTETSTHNLFSAWLPQLVLNKGEGVGKEREKEKDKGSREGSQHFSGTAPLETRSRRPGLKWMRLASMEQMQNCGRVSHETPHTLGTHQESASHIIISLLMLWSHGNRNHLAY